MVGLYQKSGKLAKAQVKKIHLNNQKKSFGVAYMDMLNHGASEEDLQEYVDSAFSGILDVQGQIDILKAEAASIDERTKCKLAHKRSQTIPVSIETAPSVTIGERLEHGAAAFPDQGSSTQSKLPRRMTPEPEFVMIDEVHPTAPVETDDKDSSTQ